jgi:L,D-transpeptidase YbiS
MSSEASRTAAAAGAGRAARAALGRLVSRVVTAAAVFKRRRVQVAAGVVLLVLVAFEGTGWDFRALPVSEAKPPAVAARSTSRELLRLRAEQERLIAALRHRVPLGTWIVIDQTHDRLRLMRGEQMLLEAPCSAGSGMILKESSGGRRVWVFDTPRGRFQVLSKAENPIWRKPDWAFVEEGELVPKNPADRLEYGSLGEYALYFGNGYMIHGTLYERLLGRPVSHGCIRLGKEPLREVFRQAPLGTPVYIY